MTSSFDLSWKKGAGKSEKDGETEIEKTYQQAEILLDGGKLCLNFIYEFLFIVISPMVQKTEGNFSLVVTLKANRFRICFLCFHQYNI